MDYIDVSNPTLETEEKIKEVALLLNSDPHDSWVYEINRYGNGNYWYIKVYDETDRLVGVL